MKGEIVMKKVSLGRFATGVLAAALIGFLAAAPAAAQGPSDPPDLKRGIAAQEAHTDLYLRNVGVVGTGVGLTADGRGVAAWSFAGCREQRRDCPERRDCGDRRLLLRPPGPADSKPQESRDPRHAPAGRGRSAG